MPYDDVTDGETMQAAGAERPRTRSEGLSEGIDPTMFSVLLHAIGQASDEMTRVLQRGARSTIISIARDHSASIYTAEAQMLYQNDALPIHTIGGALNIDATIEEFGDDINDGDVFMINDPYMGTTHNSDLTVIMPVFHEGRHLFWTSIRAHQNNTGEASFGHASTSVWQDGIQIPPVRIFERGKEVRSIIRFYLRNVRLPEWLEADLRAMVGSVRTGAARLSEMTATHGADTVLATVAEMIEYSDRRTAAEIRALPDGVYKGESWIDSDGQGTHDIRIACTVTIEDDMVHVDYSESDPQVGGHCNSSLASLQANGSIPVLTTIDPTIPRNEGCMRHIRVSAREGTVALGKWPSSTWWSTTNPGDELIEAAWKALAQAAPDRVPAGWGRIQQRLSMGDDYRTDPPTPFAASIFVAGSGGGGSKGYDGWPLTQCVCALGGLQNESVEMVELLQPLFIESNEFLVDSAGAGEWIGGHGCETVVMPYHGLLYMKFEYEGTLNPALRPVRRAAGERRLQVQGDAGRQALLLPGASRPRRLPRGRALRLHQLRRGRLWQRAGPPGGGGARAGAGRAGLARDGARTLRRGAGCGDAGHRRGGDRGAARAHAGDGGSLHVAADRPRPGALLEDPLPRGRRAGGRGDARRAPARPLARSPLSGNVRTDAENRKGE